MDPIQILAQPHPTGKSDRAPSAQEIDQFYEDHGGTVFALYAHILQRLRAQRTARARTTGPAQSFASRPSRA